MTPKKINREVGFTLIEMLVVILITAMISVISIANFRAAEKQKRVVLAADTLTNAIRNAQNFTLTGKKTNNANAACRVPQYYYFKATYTNVLTLFGFNNCSTTDTIETYTLPQGTKIKASGLVVGGTPAATDMSIVFYPPFAAIKAGTDGGAYGTFSNSQIIVESTDGTVNKTVVIDGITGRIGE